MLSFSSLLFVYNCYRTDPKAPGNKLMGNNSFSYAATFNLKFKIMVTRQHFLIALPTILQYISVNLTICVTVKSSYNEFNLTDVRISKYSELIQTSHSDRL